MKEKWHKHCGGKVVYREPSTIGVGFGQAGFCLKCDAYPIVEEDIIFKLKDDLFERLNDKKIWKVLKYKDLSEVLDGVKNIKT